MTGWRRLLVTGIVPVLGLAACDSYDGAVRAEGTKPVAPVPPPAPVTDCVYFPGDWEHQPCVGDFSCVVATVCKECGCCEYAARCVGGRLERLPATTACECDGGAGPSEPEIPDLTTCDAPMPCEIVREAEGFLGDWPPGDAALRCLIEAFRARTPGVYVRSVTHSDDESSSEELRTYLIAADGSIVRVTVRGSSRAEICEPRQPADFDACLASVSTDGYATSECRDLELTGDCVAGTVACE